MDKATTHLQYIEELLCYALMILKRTNPSNPAGPSDPTVLSITIEEPVADLEPPVAIASQPMTSPS